MLFKTRALHGPLLSEGEPWSVIFYGASGLPRSTSSWQQQLVDLGFKLPGLH